MTGGGEWQKIFRGEIFRWGERPREPLYNIGFPAKKYKCRNKSLCSGDAGDIDPGNGWPSIV